MRFWKELSKGLWTENPIFRLVLGMCPTLAVTTSLENSLGMGVAATFVLVCSNVVISMIRDLIPGKVRIPCFIVVIATFVTIVDLVMAGFAPALHANLGLFIPLIVVMAVIGSYASQGNRYDVVVMLACGLLGFGMRVFQIPEAPLIITFLVAPMAESSLRRALMINQGEWLPALFPSMLAISLAISAILLTFIAARLHISQRITELAEKES